MLYLENKQEPLEKLLEMYKLKDRYETGTNICSSGKFRKQVLIIRQREAKFPYVINDWTEIYLDLLNLFYYKIAKK